MTYEFYYRGDDHFYSRLLSLLDKKIPYQIQEIRNIRKNVYFVKTNQLSFILKGYSSYQKLRVQEAFTYSLRKEGFEKTYQFYLFDKDPFIFDGKVYGCIEYIPSHEKEFTYDVGKDRKEAIQLLERYYKVTEGLVDRYKYILPTVNLMEKWELRKEQFQHNIRIVSDYVGESVSKEILFWADEALANWQNVNLFDQDRKVILHGDVAHHNFLRNTEKQLYLIDFDLISIGPACVDYLQLANRLLPTIHWSIQKLNKLPIISCYMKEQSFVWGLLYPSDILREWNRLIRMNQLTNKNMVDKVLSLTLDQYEKRKKFCNQILKDSK